MERKRHDAIAIPACANRGKNKAIDRLRLHDAYTLHRFTRKRLSRSPCLVFRPNEL